MEHMQGELHEAKDLAKQLEKTLQAKFTTGNSSQGKSTATMTANGGRRGSKDNSSFSRHDSGHSSSHQHHEGEHSSSNLLRSHRLQQDDDEDDDEEGGHHRHSKHHHGHHHKHHHHHRGRGWGTQAIRAFKNHVVGNFCHYTPKLWRWVQDVSSFPFFLFLRSCISVRHYQLIFYIVFDTSIAGLDKSRVCLVDTVVGAGYLLLPGLLSPQGKTISSRLVVLPHIVQSMRLSQQEIKPSNTTSSFLL